VNIDFHSRRRSKDLLFDDMFICGKTSLFGLVYTLTYDIALYCDIGVENSI